MTAILARSAGRLTTLAGLLLALEGSLVGVVAQTAPVAAPARDVYAPDTVLEVAVDMPPASWDRLRSEGRSLPRTFAGCFEPNFSYTSASARVSIDGQTVNDVSVSKKGFLGSLSAERPSLRLDFGNDAHDGRTVRGVRRMTLNNNHQDPSNAKQCLAYELFARAGLPAPRCSTAHVTVNGRDRGYFTNVEPIGKPFLRRTFGNDGGNLYELTVADFTPELKAAFELKTNETRNDRRDLDRVERVLALPDSDFVAVLGTVFDVDELLTFWAMEVLTSHWDGFTGNRNNTFLYHNPADDRFHPIPWGTDGTFQPHQLLPNVPTSVFAFNTIASRLYANPATRRLYQQRLRTLLDTVWNEERIVTRMRELSAQAHGRPTAIGPLEAFIRGRRAAILAELATRDGLGPEVTTNRPFENVTCRDGDRVSGIIDFTWNDSPMAFQPVKDLSALPLQLPLPGGAIQFAPGKVAQLASINAEGVAQLAIVGQDTVRAAQVLVGIMMPVDSLQVGTVPFHGIETFGVVVQLTGAGGPRPLALIGEGTVTLTEVGRTNGAPVRGRWEGRLALLPSPAPPTP